MPSRKSLHTIPLIFIATVSIILLVRFLLFIEQHSVNILYWDQWDFLNGLFTAKDDIWSLFSYQHGPHRQGLGGLFIALIYSLSAWNVRTEVLTSASLVSLACAIAFLIKRLAFGKLDWSDILIPLTFFTLFQYETYLGASNPAHGPIPIILIISTAACLRIQTAWLKGLSLVVLTFFSIYTGFAIFSAIPVLFLLANYSWKSETVRDRVTYLLSTIGCFLSLGSFFINYQHNPAIACFKFPHDRPLQYIDFISLLFGRAFGLFNIPFNNQLIGLKYILAGILLLALVLSASVSFIRTIKRQDSQSEIIVYLSSFTLIFASFTAIGRVCSGVEAALASRYVLYSIPGVLALYFSCLRLLDLRRFPANLSRGLLIGLVLLVMIKELNIAADYKTIDTYHLGKSRWIECYLAKSDAAMCNKLANFQIYPDPNAIQDRLQFLQMRHLNFFRESTHEG